MIAKFFAKIQSFFLIARNNIKKYLIIYFIALENYYKRLRLAWKVQPYINIRARSYDRALMSFYSDNAILSCRR